MTNNTMREALLKFGDENPALDLDFRLHTHGKYLTQEKAIVASRAFKAGAAWQAAQSVPVVGEPIYWIDPDDDANLSRIGRVGWSPLYGESPAAELATLREKAARLEQVEKERDEANARLHDVSVACATAEQERDELRKKLAAYDRLNKELDAAIAQGKGE